MSKKEQALAISVKKSEDISKWYTQVIQKADLIDYTKVSGCVVYKPNSYLIWEKIRDFVDLRFKEVGLKNTYFPIFIPESLLNKEEEHVEGFSPEVAWVTHTGNTELAERLAIRPTSETIMYDSYSKWIRSYRDLPLRLNQWNNVVRWEFKHSTPFLRSREFLWNEGHTVFATKEEAEAERDEILNIYEETLRELMAIHSVRGQKSQNEKFAGAQATFSQECFLETGKAIQGPDFHLDGQNFAKAFDISFIDEKGKKQYVWQNTFAITTRMIGIMIMIHSDDRGFVLPPRLAENKIVIVPLLFKGKEKKVLDETKKLAKKLKSFNPIIDDDSKIGAGFKFGKWEIQGIPIRIELGPRDVENNKMVLVLRDNNEKKEFDLNDSKIEEKLEKHLEEMQERLYQNSKNFVEKNVKICDTIKEFESAKNKKEWPLVKWCGEVGCEESIKEKYGAKSNNIPFEQPKKAQGKCVFCDCDAKYYALICKSL